MKVFKYILSLVVLTGAAFTALSQKDNLLVDMPVPPADMNRIDERSNYIVDNFWKRLDFKGAFSSLDRMEATLGQFFAIAPYATADTVYMAIDRLITGVEKANASNLLPLARMAERWCGNDTSAYASEDLMLPFARAVANSKKIKGADKEYYRLMAQRMENSRRGVVPADFTFITPGNGTGRLSDITEPSVLLFFYDPKDFQSRLGRTRLGSDFVVNTLIDHNKLRVVALYPGEPDEVWQKDVESMPSRWIIGASPALKDYYTINRMPVVYFLDENRKITDKDISVDAALLYFGQFLKAK